MDVGEWAKRGLVDFIVASPFLTTDFAMPIEEMRAAMGQGSVPIYGAFDISHGDHQLHCPESLRAAALGLYGSGADGIYVFNFPCWIERLAARPYDWLSGLERPETTSRKPLLFSVAHAEKRMAAKVDLPHHLPASLPPGESLELPLPLPAAALPAWRCLVSVVAGGDVALSVNGTDARERCSSRRADLFVQFENRPAPGRKTRARHADEDSRLFGVASGTLRAGVNFLRVLNRANQALTLERVNLGLW